MPSGLFPLPQQTSTASRAAGTPPDTKAQRIVSLTAACRGIWPPLRLHDKPCVSKHPHFPHKHKYVQQQWETQMQAKSSDVKTWEIFGKFSPVNYIVKVAQW